MVSPGELRGLPPRQAMRQVQDVLRQAGCPDSDYDARELCRLALGADPRLINDAPLTAAQAAALAQLTGRRAAREPLQYLAGAWDFLDFTLKVGPGVLCPRPDSEVVCETAIELLQGQRAPQVLDLCAGTGCLGLGIKRFVPGAVVRCVEKDPAAYAYLVYNAAHALKGYGEKPAVTPVQADVQDFWRTLPGAGATLIISNPPYLTGEEMRSLMPETAHEPALALDGGVDGLLFYRLLLRHYRAALAPGGWLVLEIGCQQAQAVQVLAAQNGWQQIRCRKDYGGNDRVVVARAPQNGAQTDKVR